jgi:hypothetical protein
VIFPFGRDITLQVRTKTGTDAYGNDVFSTAPTVVKGAFAPGGSTEQVQGQNVLITQPTIYLQPGTDVSAVDAVDIDGDRFEVDGTPNDWINPFTGWSAGVEVRLRRVTG